MSDEKLTYLADVEVIADTCETMLKNSKIFEDIAQGNPTIAQKLKDKLKNFIARLKQLLNKTNALTHEGKLLEECVTEFENIQKLWDKTVTDGIKTVNALHAEQKNNTVQNYEQYQSRTADIDNEYLEAVKNNDLETAQKLVDEAAKENGYTIKAYHGTPNGTFNVFKNWQYFTENRNYADVYQSQGASSNGYKPTENNLKTYGVYLKGKKVFDTRKPECRKIFMNEFYQKWGNGAPLSDRGLPDWTDGYDFIYFFEENDYDYDVLLLDEGATGADRFTGTGNCFCTQIYESYAFCRRRADSQEEFTMKKMCVNEKSYEVIKLLGHGKGGYSYLVTDGTKEYVLKQIHHEPCDYYQFGNKIESEMKDYKRLKEIGIPMPEMFEVDIENERILKEYIKGDTVFDYVLRKEIKPTFVEQMKEMCAVLYPANTNIDYFPTNFVVQEDKLYYIDYECNDYMEEWNFENWGIKYWSQTKEFLEYVNKG